jgi:hypothetical protein
MEPTAVWRHEVPEVGSGRAIVALDTVGLGAADEKVAIESEDETMTTIESPITRRDKIAEELASHPVEARDTVILDAGDQKVAIRANEQAVGIGQVTVARRDEGAEERPVGPVIAHDASIVRAAHEQVDAETEPVFEGLDGEPLGSTTTSRQPTEGRAVCPFRPAMLGTGA